MNMSLSAHFQNKRDTAAAAAGIVFVPLLSAREQRDAVEQDTAQDISEYPPR
jgi:hypothetical protein